MRKLINRYTNTVMWVADDRVEKYIKAGHVPADVKKPEKKPATRRKKTEDK